MSSRRVSFVASFSAELQAFERYETPVDLFSTLRAIADVYWLKDLPATLRTWVWELFVENMKPL